MNKQTRLRRRTVFYPNGNKGSTNNQGEIIIIIIMWYATI